MTSQGSELPAVGLDRRAAALTALISAGVLTVLVLWLVPWDWVPGGELVPATPESLFSRGEIERAEDFAFMRRALSWSSYAVSLAFALWLGLTSVGSRLTRRVAGRLRWWVAVPVGTLLVLVLGRLVTLPFSLLIRRQNLAYDLTRQDLVGWAGDQLRSLLVSWVLTSLLLVVLVGCARRSPRHWFAWAGSVVVALTLLGSFLYPVVVEPLFNTFTPLPAGPLRSRVLQLAEAEGVQVDDVLVADASRRTTTLNAYVSGIGSTRRVVLYDTLLENAPQEEVEVIVAHELAHARNDDVLVGTGLGAVGGVLGVSVLALLLDSRRLQRWSGTAGPSDPAVVALVLALGAVGAFVSSPVVNTVSRAVEVRADRESLEATGMEDVFVRMQRRLAVKSVQDPTPPAWSQLWFGSHPTVLERAGLPRSLSEVG